MASVFDESGIETETRRVRWSEIVSVGIRTTADGPMVEDLFWIFLLREGSIELPGALVGGEALDVLGAHLPALDYAKIIEATGSVDERVYRVWHVDGSHAGWDDASYRARFAALVGALGGDASRSGDVFDRLVGAWSERNRRYHDREHLADCLRELDAAHAEPAVAARAELALWFHDAVYVPGARDSEKRSAAMLLAEADALGIPSDAARAAADLVRATASHGAVFAKADPARDLVLDVDLSILGRDVLRFLEYEYAIEEEHPDVPTLAFRIARGRFLASLLRAPNLYRTAFFRDRHEATARANVAALLRSPRYRAHRLLGWVPGSFGTRH